MKRRSLALLAAGLLALGALADRVFNVATNTTPASPVAAETPANAANTTAYAVNQTTVQAYASASKSVVYIVNKGVGSGSGIIYDRSGDIVTNNHVVSGASSLSVTLNNGKTYSASLVGADVADDLAVIRIHASNLTPATFATAGGYQVGESVLAIGSPLGLKQSVSFGLVSGIHRVEQEENGAYLSDAVQTSAPINPGNSGGALVTLQGVVVGMPTLEQTTTTNGQAAQSIGFAIPSERIVLLARQIVATGKVQHTGRAYLGVTPTDASGQSSQSPFGGNGFGPSQGVSTTGALVARLSASGPAATAGVQQDDVITAADGTPVTTAQDLLTIIAAKKSGDSLTLTIDRNGSSTTVHVHLGELPA